VGLVNDICHPRQATKTSAPVTVLGRGSKVIGGTIRTELTRSEIEKFANSDLILRRVERIEGGAWWRAELARGGTGSTRH